MFFSYEFETIKSVCVSMSIAASKGYIYVFAVSAEKSIFNSDHQNFENISNSFTLFTKS